MALRAGFTWAPGLGSEVGFVRPRVHVTRRDFVCAIVSELLEGRVEVANNRTAVERVVLARAASTGEVGLHRWPTYIWRNRPARITNREQLDLLFADAEREVTRLYPELTE